MNHIEDGVSLAHTQVVGYEVGQGNAIEADFRVQSTYGNLAPAGLQNPSSFSTVFGAGGSTKYPTYDHFLSEDTDRVQWVPSRWFTRGALRLEVRTSDVEHNGTTERTAVIASNENVATGPDMYQRIGDEMWYGLAVRFDGNYPVAPPGGGWLLLQQWFAQNITLGVSGGSPPLALEVYTNGQFRIEVRGGAKATAGDTAPETTVGDIGLATTGVPHFFLFHVKWSDTSSGLVEVWHRAGGQVFPDTPQFSHTGINMLTVGGTQLDTYLQTCLYRSTRAETQAMEVGVSVAQPSRQKVEEALDESVQKSKFIVGVPRSTSQDEYPTFRESFTGNNALATGTVYYVYFVARRSMLITKLGAYVNTASVGATKQRLGLYTVNPVTFDLTPVAHTANVATLFDTTTKVTSSLVSLNLDATAGSWPTSYQIVEGASYCIGVISVGHSTIPQLRGLSLVNAIYDDSPKIVQSKTAQTDIGGGNAAPGSVVTAASIFQTGVCPGVVVAE